MFLAEGIRTVEELLASSLEVRGALISPTLRHTERGATLADGLERLRAGSAMMLAEVSDTELAGAAGTDSPQGVLAIVRQPERSFENISMEASARILVLDGVQDPGNVGTILRTAEAFGVTATVALSGSVDLWNPKVVRSAMGALFRQHAFAADADDLLSFCDANGFELWTSDARGEALDLVHGAPERLAIVVGNEGGGVSPSLAQAARRSVAIPIRGVESLNVAVAAGILLHALSR